MGFHRPMDWAIRPGVGLGPLVFGVPQHEVAHYFGKPDEVSEEELSFDFTIAWYYWELGVSAHFDREDDYRLGALEIERDDVTLVGLRLIGLSERRTQELLTPFALGPTETRVVSRADSRRLVAYSEQQLFLYFQNGALDCIQWTPLRSADDRLVWPP